MSAKVPFTLEINFQASPQLLYQYLSTPSGLSEWFADNVNSRGEDFTFIWDDTEEYAKLIKKKTNEKVRYRWITEEEDQDDYFFEFHYPSDPKYAGTQYRSAIFVHTPEQQVLAEAACKQRGQIGTFIKIEKASDFYRAEEYHQKYVEKSTTARY